MIKISLEKYNGNAILFSLLLGLNSVQSSFGNPVSTQNIAVKSVEKSKEKIILQDLEFKTVMMALYQKDIQYVKIQQLDNNNVDYVGIKNAEHTAISEKNDAVIVFSPAKIYRNAQNELRYLISTPEVSIDKNNEVLNFCGVCATFTQIYLFKKNTVGKFELISQSQDQTSWMNGDFDFSPYSTEKIIKNIRKIGPNVKGYVEEQAYSRQGYSNTQLYIVPFDEKPVMIKLDVAQIAHDNEVTGSDKIYNTHADYRFLSTEHHGLYDIKIHYWGTQQIYIGDTAKIISINETRVYHYNEQQQKYIRVK